MANRLNDLIRKVEEEEEEEEEEKKNSIHAHGQTKIKQRLLCFFICYNA
jgi:hypothetical protein